MIMGSLNSSEFFCACLFDCPDATHHVTRMSDFLVHLHDCSRCRIDNFFVFFWAPIFDWFDETHSLTKILEVCIHTQPYHSNFQHEKILQYYTILKNIRLYLVSYWFRFKWVECGGVYLCRVHMSRLFKVSMGRTTWIICVNLHHLTGILHLSLKSLIDARTLAIASLFGALIWLSWCLCMKS